jgi:hypothetical protein
MRSLSSSSLAVDLSSHSISACHLRAHRGVVQLHFVFLEGQEFMNFCLHVLAVLTSHVLVLVGTSKGGSSSHLSLSCFSLLVKTERARLARLDHIAGNLEPREVARPLSDRMARFKSHFRRESDKIMLLLRSVYSTNMTVTTDGDALDSVALRNTVGSLKQGRLL